MIRSFRLLTPALTHWRIWTAWKSKQNWPQCSEDVKSASCKFISNSTLNKKIAAEAKQSLKSNLPTHKGAFLPWQITNAGKWLNRQSLWGKWRTKIYKCFCVSFCFYARKKKNKTKNHPNFSDLCWLLLFSMLRCSLLKAATGLT